MTSTARLTVLAPLAHRGARRCGGRDRGVVVRTGVGRRARAAARPPAGRRAGRATRRGRRLALRSTPDLEPGDVVVATEVRPADGARRALAGRPLVAGDAAA